MLITNKSATSLSAGEEVRLNVLFMRGDKIIEHWRDATFQTHISDGDKRAFISEPLALTFLDAFAGAEYMVAMTMKNAGVGGAKLEGSAEAIRQLRNCGFAAAGLNPHDPFLK